MSPDVIGWAVWSVSSSLNIAISLNITIGLLLTDIIVILRFDYTFFRKKMYFFFIVVFFQLKFFQLIGIYRAVLYLAADDALYSDLGNLRLKSLCLAEIFSLIRADTCEEKKASSSTSALAASSS